MTGVLTWSVRGDKASLLRLRTASIVRGGQTEKTEQSLMMTLAGNAAIARASGKASSSALLPGLRVTIWATSQKGGALVDPLDVGSTARSRRGRQALVANTACASRGSDPELSCRRSARGASR